jgi:nucleotide-binding universal stress UspA family protein
MKILLAVDDSKYSEAAMQAVLQQMQPEASEVRILHVVKPLLIIPRSYIGQVENLQAAQQERLKEGKELVARTGQLLSQAGFKVHTDVEEGDARTAIIDYAARWYADLIMMGSHGRTGLDKLLIGSVSEAVLRHAPCSVEIVRLAELRDAQVLQNTSARSRRSS